jgi:aromatic ring-opening dioxygenase catalytic subunit (LigB family)
MPPIASIVKHGSRPTALENIMSTQHPQSNNAGKMPVYFLSHGGGPWPFVDSMRQQYARTEQALRALPERLPATPKAVLVVTAHWEAAEFSVSSAERPPMLYDYGGFPANTYQVQYAAPGSPALAARVVALLTENGMPVRQDASRGFDHGTFVPLSLIYPEANVPVVMLSIKASYDPAEHIRLGKALQPLRDEGVLIIGSGLNYHNMRGFGRPESTAVAEAFDAYLNRAIGQPSADVRDAMLADWESAPGARLSHPHEDHLLPLMVVAGAAGNDAGHQVLAETVMQIPMASYEFGGKLQPGQA